MSEATEFFQSYIKNYADFGRVLQTLALVQDNEWCGAPIPLPGQSLTIEDRNPHAAHYRALQDIINSDKTIVHACTDDDDMEVQEINRWHSSQHNGWIVVYRTAGGRVKWMLDYDVIRRNKFWLGPLSTYEAWSIQAEVAAMDALRGLIKPHLFEMYFLTGIFLETSKRSGLTYMFRRLRPTLVLSGHAARADYFHPNHRDPGMHIICALCLHPIAYYDSTFCGAMTPTDDVIAHLLMMRADEHMFWKRANQHPAWAAEAGL
jgi:hypothetical protein